MPSTLIKDDAVSTASVVEFVNGSFAPCIALITSPDAENVCLKNNLSCVEMLIPFSHLSVEAAVKDPTNQTHVIRNLRLDIRELRTDGFLLSSILPHVLSDALHAINASDSLIKTKPNDGLSDCDPSGLESAASVESNPLSDHSVTTIGNYDVKISETTPWYTEYSEKLFHCMEPGDQEFLKHYLACILMVSTSHPDPLDQLTKLSQSQHAQQHQSSASAAGGTPHRPGAAANVLSPGGTTHHLSTSSPDLTQMALAGAATNSDGGPVSPVAGAPPLGHTGGSTGTHDPAMAMRGVIGGGGSGNIQHGGLTLPRHTATPKWFSPNIFKYHVLLHDMVDGDEKKAESVYQSMKMTYGSHACHLLRINSVNLKDNNQATSYALPDSWAYHLTKRERGYVNIRTNANVPRPIGTPSFNHIPSIPTIANGLMAGATEQSYPSETLPHALSVSDFSANPNCNPSAPSCVGHGICLASPDLDRIKIFVQEFCLRGLLPFVERQMRILNDQIMSRRNLKKSIISVTTKWFGGGSSTGGGSGGTPIPPVIPQQVTNSVIYTQESTELQIRRLADLAFLFHHYELAFTWYHLLKKDFQNDGAWLHFAGSLEMAALCIFMLGASALRPYPAHYMETALTTYTNTCCKPLLAARACILSTNILKSMGKYNESADQYIRTTNPETDLCSALFLEQASRCFVKCQLARKFSLHMILAGHRFSKANHRVHAVRAYSQAFQVYKGKNWKLAEDHINYTVGHHAIGLHQMQNAVTSFRQLLYDHSNQSAAQHLNFMKEYLSALKILLSETSSPPRGGYSFHLPVINASKTTVICGELGSRCGMHDFHKKCCWDGLEKCAWTFGNAKRVPQMSPSKFVSCYPFLNDKTDNSSAPEVYCNEPFVAELSLYNPLLIPIHLTGIQLLWRFVTATDEAVVTNADGVGNKFDTLVTTQTYPALTLKSGGTQMVPLSVTPHIEGSLSIQGIAYGLTVLGDETGSSRAATPTDLSGFSKTLSETSNSLSPDRKLMILGQQKIEIQGRRLNSTKFEKMNILYGSDKRLDPRILPAMPQLRIDCSPPTSQAKKYPEDVFCGETIHRTLTLHNISSTIPIKLVSLASRSWPISVSHPSSSPDSSQSLASRLLQSVSDNSISKVESSNSRFYDCDNCHSRHVVLDLQTPALPTTSPLAAGASLPLSLAVTAPAKPGEGQTIEIVLMYESANEHGSGHTPPSKWRFARVSFTVNCRPLLGVMASFNPSVSCGTILSNRLVSFRSHNMSKATEHLSTAVELLKICIVSYRWKLSQLLHMKKAIHLLSGEVETVLLDLTAIESSIASLQSVPPGPVCSEIHMGSSIPGPSGSDIHGAAVVPKFAVAHLIDNWKAGGSSQGGAGFHNSAGGSEASHFGEGFGDKDGKNVLAVWWKAVNICADGTRDCVYGQSWVDIGQMRRNNQMVGDPISLITPSREEMIQETLRLRDPVLSYHVEFPALLYHDFSTNQLCPIPVTLWLCNNSTGPLDVQVSCCNGIANNSDQHLQALVTTSGYRNVLPVLWTSHTNVNNVFLSVDKPSNCVQLRVLVTGPGVYDVTSNLTVTYCRAKESRDTAGGSYVMQSGLTSTAGQDKSESSRTSAVGGTGGDHSGGGGESYGSMLVQSSLLPPVLPQALALVPHYLTVRRSFPPTGAETSPDTSGEVILDNNNYDKTTLEMGFTQEQSVSSELSTISADLAPALPI